MRYERLRCDLCGRVSMMHASMEACACCHNSGRLHWEKVVLPCVLMVLLVVAVIIA